jgi:hypothetical protein
MANARGNAIANPEEVVSRGTATAVIPGSSNAFVIAK